QVDAGRRMARGAARVARIERQIDARPVAADGQPGLRRELRVDAHASLLLGTRALLIEVEAGPLARVAVGLRLALVLEVREVVDAVPLDGTAQRGAELLVLVRQNAVLEKVLRDETIA